ncbi:U3 small nucleolar RNA-associated protein 6 homolog [Pogonomyrmex barbatus]|uniref:U3 small nucleolar RNA-associated protein 6 homolog n=1 Tax=Pogonomyrmex barbatus TaxID=144034 RepID=A0A6I9WD29_9HYME|nr:U3 small nucleolar RNA-associated protein 6 homolog [Pogonomyrmex barbatus]
MAEFVEKRCQDMIPELEQMERIKLFDKNEIRNIAKKLKEYEYKIQRHTKCKEDYLRYIQYLMDLLKLIKQRRDKYGNTQKKSDIDFAITNKINNLYKEAISKFQDDIRFWLAYMKFCKHMRFHSSVTHMLGRMLQIHRDKPKCWHIAACWELEENDNKQSARQYLLRGLQIHPDSQLLYIDAFKLELNDRLTTPPNNAENSESQENSSASPMDDVTSEMPIPLKTAYFIYQQAFEYIKDIKFIIELLDITKEYKDTEKLQKKIICDMIREYTHEPLMWDTMARRELQGLVQPGLSDTPMEVENAKQTSLRDRITSCNEVYQTAVKKIKTEEMWSLYIDCLLKINNDLRSLPNFKRKLLKTALMQAHQAKKLNEKYYLSWIDLLTVDKEHDESARKKLKEILREATDALPNSLAVWHMRLSYLLQHDQEKEAYALYPKVTQLLGEKAVPLWKMRIFHARIRSSDEVEESFQAALKYPLIARDIKPEWLEWLVLTEGIRAARKAYDSLCLQPPTTLEFHKKMAMLELIQPEVSLKYMRRPYDMAILQFGTNSTSVWLDYIKFEMKHGDPKNVSSLHERAVKMLDHSLISSFIEDYSLIVANPDTIK